MQIHILLQERLTDFLYTLQSALSQHSFSELTNE